MWWIVSLIVLALLAWFVVRMLQRNAAGPAAATPDPLEHDRDGLNRPLPGQRAATDGEVHDAARSHVGGHLETHPDGVPERESALEGTDIGGSLDPDRAARAAEASRDSGGTGTAVLAGIATAAATGAAAAAGRDGRETPDGTTDPETRANAPDAETAGTLDVAASRAAAEGTASPPAASVAAGAGESPSGERVPHRDDAATNAPVADAAPGNAAREPLEPAPGAGGAADAHHSPDERVNAPDPDEAGTGVMRDRASDARSNLVAGTVSLGIGGAAVLEDGATPAEHAAGAAGGAALPSDSDRLGGGDARANVREMLKILNLRESDASRLGVSDEDFGRLWRGEADDGLVGDVHARLRRMIG